MLDKIDCLIVGGGPAGLTAAIYLARFRLRVKVVDEGRGRAAQIPCSRNHAGFPGGIAGADLLARMREQGLEYGVDLEPGRIDRLEARHHGFTAFSNNGAIDCRAVLIATGVTNHRPAIPEALHHTALNSGRVRYCPVCDGYEVTDRPVGVIGTGARGLKEAIFLRSFTSKVTLIAPEGVHSLDGLAQSQLAAANVPTVDGPPTQFELHDDSISFRAGGERRAFYAVYPAMGSEIHSGLAKSLGADLTEEGCIKVDAHQRTSVAFLYAAGDVVVGLDQISHAMGEGGVAATTMRNDLAASGGLLRR